MVFTIMYMTGALGNLAALTILYRNEKKTRNKKMVLMLRCLASNDLVALMGMLILMKLQVYLPNKWVCSHEFCVARVIWRQFGLSSGCVAVVMAVERWLALTHPFLYQKHITYNIIRRSIFCLWFAVLVLVCLPFTGFGLYYDSGCVRYRDATETIDIAYAYLFFVFGTLLCVCIVVCNLAVIRVLCRLGCQRSRSRILGRRISRNSKRTRSLSSGSSSTTGVLTNGEDIITYYNVSTPEELAFARLMAVLCVAFVVCWMPQMVSILLAQWASGWAVSRIFYRVADGLIMLHFILDPLFYVLLRCFPKIPKALFHSCRSHPSGPTSLALTDNGSSPTLNQITQTNTCQNY